MVASCPVASCPQDHVLTLETIIVSPFQQNSRIIIESQRRIGSIVDPGGDIPSILAAMDRAESDLPGLVWESIVLTHAHIDHAGGVLTLQRALESRGRPAPKLYGHALDRPLREAIRSQALLFSLPPDEYQNCPEPDVLIQDGDRFLIGEREGTVLFTPGHAPGHVSVYFPEGDFTIRDGGETTTFKAPVVIAGDALFYGSIGRTDLPFGDTETLLASIREKLFTLPDETIVLTGHGPSTTIGRERKLNPFFN
ncbi:MAG: MBL fold metallo-hydrolase [Deltaproteobacteria bacterium]|nr:MBL fold metallo-hydrolase [Deltaproteobacteria bacterium]